MNIAIGCDEAAFEMKEILKEFLSQKGHTVKDFGAFDKTPLLYPDVAAEVSKSILAGESERGILICGTGIGMCISANKFKGIRAAVCHDIFSTERAQKSNDAQVMCLGARIIAPELAKKLAEVWLQCEFEGGGSTAKVERINYYDLRSE